MRKKAIELTTTWKGVTEGDAAEGIYIKKETVEGNYGPQDKYILETPEGDKIGIFATKGLARQFNNVPEGAYVWIVYKGEQTTRAGRTVKVYDVEYDDEYQK